MANPMQMYQYIHDAILREAAHIEEIAKDLNRKDNEAVRIIDESVSWFRTVTKAHELAEEKILFPALENKHKHLTSSYEFDHDHFGKNYFDELKSGLNDLTASRDDGEGIHQAKRVHRQSIGLNESMRLHVLKENELLLPIASNEFDTPELIEIAGAMAASFDPPLMAKTVGWMFQGQNIQDREGMIRFLMNALPEEAFGNTAKMLSQLSSPAEWRELGNNIPGLI